MERRARLAALAAAYRWAPTEIFALTWTQALWWEGAALELAGSR